METIDSPIIVKPKIQISGYNLRIIVHDDLGVNLANSNVILSSVTKLQVYFYGQLRLFLSLNNFYY